MSAPAAPGGALPQRRTDQVRLLDAMDSLRSLGVGEVADLPQMIICGSKSNAKRSVIEAISHVGFPVRYDFSNGFVTEIILRRESTPRFKVSIRYGPWIESDEDLQNSKIFVPTVYGSTDQSVSLIEKATTFIRPFAYDGFCVDILQVEVSGPDQPDLTIIDMPRLYFTEGINDQDERKSFGRHCIEKYVLNARSIILPVVSAKIDICSQKINDFADKYDPDRKRILGIVTHLDTLEASSDEEKLWLKAIQEATTEQALGLHLVSTRSYETRDVPEEDRDQKEKEFFERGDWKTVARRYIGTDNLRRRLSTILANHIQSSLPDIISEIEKTILDNQASLGKLNAPRETALQQRALLVNLSSAFQRLTEQALSGMYIDDFFATSVDDGNSKTPDPRRLRSIIRQLNKDFADVMEVAGCRRFIHGVNNQITGLVHHGNPYANIRCPEHKSRADFEVEVLKKMHGGREIELPGNFRQLLVSSLFREQSQPWEEIARAHLMKSWETTQEFVSALLGHLTDQETSLAIMSTLICPRLNKMKANLLAKVDELTASNKRGYPLPLSQSFLTKRQISGDDHLFETLQQKLSSTFTIEELKAATQDMESSTNWTAASDIIDQLQSHYNVSPPISHYRVEDTDKKQNALLVFVDNIAILAIENCLLAPLKAVFTTETITSMEDIEIEELCEGLHRRVARSKSELTDELTKLQIGLLTLKQFKIAKEITAPTGAIKQPGSGSAHGSSSLQSLVMPQGVLCNSASTIPFGLLSVDSGVQGQNSTARYQLSWPYTPVSDMQTSLTVCPSGPFGLNPGMVNARTESAPSASFPLMDSSQKSGNPGAFELSGATLPVPQTSTPSMFCSRQARPVTNLAPHTRDHDQNWYREDKETRDTGSIRNRCHSICFHEKYINFSPEELRLADYELDRETF
ncbi:Dynamin [Penicillium expansum]|nr:Dynamin [Penicillium expansum]